MVEVSEEDSWRMKLSANTNSQLPPLNDSELWESIFAIDEFDENQDVEASASSPDSVLDDQSGFRKGRGNKNASQKPRDRLVVATDYSRGEGCGKLVSTLFGEDLKVMERLMHSSTELPSFKVCVVEHTLR